MPLARLIRRIAPAALVTAATLCSGCEIGELLDPGGDRALVQFFATHHATPEDGSFPHRGGDGEVRTFDNDTGWTVMLKDAYVVTAAASLSSCNAKAAPVDFYYGPLPEDFTNTDLDLSTIGSVNASPDEYCTLTVDYAPYDPSQIDGERHMLPEAAPMEGATFYMSGVATRGDERVEFEFRSETRVTVELDLSQVEDGAPFTVTGDEQFPRELTLAKTYDRFFDDLDFSDYDRAEVEDHILGVLSFETRVHEGTQVGS